MLPNSIPSRILIIVLRKEDIHTSAAAANQRPRAKMRTGRPELGNDEKSH
jgi:hypothetical protein